MNKSPYLEIPADVNELLHLRCALERLEGIVASKTIDSLKRVVLNRITKLEVAIDEGIRLQATPMYEPDISRTSF
jgi:hypothetical protein